MATKGKGKQQIIKSTRRSKPKRDNGEGSIYERSDGRWEAKLTVIDPQTGKKKRRSFMGATKEEARSKMVLAQAELQKGTYIAPIRDSLTIWLNYWLNELMKPSLKQTTYSQYETMIRVHIIPELGTKTLQKIETADIQRFYNIKAKSGKKDGTGGLSPKTIRHIHNVLRLALDQAVLEGKIPRNPCKAAKLPRKEEKELTILKEPEVLHLLETCKEDHQLYTAVLVECYTGLRRGELLGLRWRDLDLVKGVLKVTQQVQRVPTNTDDKTEEKTKIVIETPKTRSSRRPIPLLKKVTDELKKIKAAQSEYKLKFGNTYKDFGLVFCQPEGNPHDPRAFTRKYERYLSKAKLPEISFHSLRHSSAMMLQRAGVPLKVIQEILGHSDFTTTANIYGDHIDMTMMRDAIQKLDIHLDEIACATETNDHEPESKVVNIPIPIPKKKKLPEYLEA